MGFFGDGDKSDNLVGYDGAFIQRVGCIDSTPSHSRSRLMDKFKENNSGFRVSGQRYQCS
ncbi:hypothetical protein [Coleofasciculus sp. E2-BRE-01]|uniref:hypothetical protein n=1 Tax=Coleofasciculus sp. E2-BRE-01 TaxID=3069524 RepID=UPI0032F1BFF9